MKCCSLSRNNVRGIVTVIGGCLIHMTLSTTYLFGNMTPYLTSYLRERSNSINTSYTETIWISTAQSITVSGAMPILGLLERKIPPKYCALLGAWTFSSATALTFFTVKESVAWTLCTYGVLCTLGKSLAYPAAVKCGLQWFPDRRGLVTGLIIAGIGTGTFIFNEVITFFINPENMLPEVLEGDDDLYFDQPSLLDRVPFCFLLLGGVYATMQLIAVLLIQRPSTDTQLQTSEPPVDETPDIDACSTEEDATQLPTEETEKCKDYSPLQMLRTKMFYIFYSIMLFTTLGTFFIGNFYKTFSQTFIKDDHFIALAGSIGSVFNALARPTWGALGDRLGYREALVLLLAIFGTSAATFTLCEFGGKVMLMIWMCLIYGSFPGLYCIMPTLLASVFGQKFYMSNYGLLFSCAIVTQLAGSVMVVLLKQSIGWKGVLYIGASSVFLSLFLAICITIWYRRTVRRSKRRPVETAQNMDPLLPVET